MRLPAPDIAFTGWPSRASLLSPWNISATALQLQFVLRQMGRNTNTVAREAGAALDDLSSLIFQHTLSSEEAFFVAQMTRGVGVPVAAKVCQPLQLPQRQVSQI
jgi:mediator of RNA polymerase II transcription subunit 12, fungi type